jgi:hypothetical protein
MLYACSAWHYPTNSYGFKGKRDREVKVLQAIQKEALWKVIGAFRATAGAVLEVETHCLPMRERL